MRSRDEEDYEKKKTVDKENLCVENWEGVFQEWWRMVPIRKDTKVRLLEIRAQSFLRVQSCSPSVKKCGIN